MENKSLRGLVVCRNFLQDPVIKALLAARNRGIIPLASMKRQRSSWNGRNSWASAAISCASISSILGGRRYGRCRIH